MRIIGTDINSAALAAAREGRYGTRAVSLLDDEDLLTFFERDGNGWRVGEQLRSLVEFRQHNLACRSPSGGTDRSRPVPQRPDLLRPAPDARCHRRRSTPRWFRADGCCSATARRSGGSTTVSNSYAMRTPFSTAAAGRSRPPCAVPLRCAGRWPRRPPDPSRLPRSATPWEPGHTPPPPRLPSATRRAAAVGAAALPAWARAGRDRRGRGSTRRAAARRLSRPGVRLRPVPAGSRAGPAGSRRRGGPRLRSGGPGAVPPRAR